jgi:hypothetical protein
MDEITISHSARSWNDSIENETKHTGQLIGQDVDIRLDIAPDSTGIPRSCKPIATLLIEMNNDILMKF